MAKHGETWRAAYGPRLRKWNGNTDQFEGVIKRLKEDPVTKRAVMNIFDPSSDYRETKDVPCNNWLHFIQRNGYLDLNVAVRANDAIWGFSGINFFEWSVLHELVATTMGWRVGTLSWFVGTFHIYNRHFNTASKLAHIENPKSMYECGVGHTNITTTLHDLDSVLDMVFESEKYSKTGNFNKSLEIEKKINDKFFCNSAKFLKIFNALKLGVDQEIIKSFVNELAGDDFKIAAIEYLSRKWKCTEYLYEIHNISPEFYYAFKQMQEQTTEFEMII